MKKLSKITIILVLIILTLTTSVYAVSVSIKLETEKQENTIILHIKLDKINIDSRGITGLVTDIEYDKNVFETINEEDIVLQNGWTDILYNENTDSVLLLRDEPTKETGIDIVQIKLNKKANVDVSKTEVKLTSIQATDAKHDVDIEDSKIQIRFSGIDLGQVLSIIILAIAVIIALLFVTRFIFKNSSKRRIRK